jgi:palmitoyl-protein thioesterase
MNDLKLMIEKAHPSTNVTVIKLYPEVESIFTPMWDQINGVSEVLEEIMAQSKDGIHLIGFSQGISNYMRSIMSFMRHIFLSFKGNIYS